MTKKILWGLVLAAGLGVIAWVLFSGRETGSRFVAAPPLAPATAPKIAEEPQPSQPKPTPPPMRLSFEAAGAPALDKPVPVTLRVESSLEGWPAQLMGKECQMELLLRLPPGVKLRSEGWQEKPLPPEEEEDGSGPWSLFERKQPLSLPEGVPPQVLVKETTELAVVERGVNWVITARARLVHGSEAWQTFGVLFATLEGEKAAFHARPFTPMDVPLSEPTPEEQRAATD